MTANDIELNSKIEKGMKPSSSVVKLKRELGLFSATNLILGIMIGSGIFVSPSSALEYSGSVALCVIVWAVSGGICLLGALSFAELGTVVSKSGAEHAFLQEAFSNLHGFWGPVPAFLFSWVNVLALRPAAVAIVSMVFAQYLILPFVQDLEDYYKNTAIDLTSLAALFIMTYINIRSVKLFIKVQNVFVACKVLACLVVIGGGIYEIARGNTANLSKGFEGSSWNAGDIALAMYSGLFAYDGWNQVTAVTEEIINPSRNIPLSIMIGVPLITVLYVFMNIAYMTVLTYKEMTSVSVVALAFGAKVLGPANFLIPLAVSISAFSCALGVQFGVSRIGYAAARSGHMMEVLAFVNIHRNTPAPAVALQAFITTIYIVVGNIKELIEFVSWFLWFFYGIAMVALLVLRKTHAKKARPFKVPTIIPFFVILVSIFLSVLPIAHDPSIKYVVAIGYIVLGFTVYTIFVYHKKTPTAILNKLTFLIQVLFESVPPSDDRD